MMLKNFEELPSEDLGLLTFDARLVAFRWDLMPSCLLWDLDVQVTEGVDAPMQRGWLCFSGVLELTWDLEPASIPTGIWLGWDLEVLGSNLDGFSEYKTQAVYLKPKASPGDYPKTLKISITAKSAIGLLSNDGEPRGEYGLDLKSRRQYLPEEVVVSYLEERLAHQQN